MHGLKTIHLLEQRNAEAERIMAQDHSAEAARKSAQLDADIAEARNRLEQSGQE